MTTAIQPSSNTAVEAEVMPPPVIRGTQALSAFSNGDSFELSQRMAKALASSTMVPPAYQNHIGNCIVALELAQRLGDSPLVIMQNMAPIHGKPAWSATFIIAKINQTGRFSPLRFRMSDDKKSCYAEAKSLQDGEILKGTEITWKMVEAEGWSKKQGSKWLTMPEQMFKYRAATFWAREHAPEVLVGMRTVDELEDINDLKPAVVTIEAPQFAPPPQGEAAEAPKRGRPRKVQEPVPEPVVMPTPTPKPPAVPEGTEPEPNTPQQELANQMAANQVSFTAFTNWAGATDRLPNHDTYGTWDELPTEWCASMLSDTKALEKCVIRNKGK